MKAQFIKKLLKLISNSAGCNIQYRGCPCNTCFHTWAESELELTSKVAHAFWLVILSLRGDYTAKEIKKFEF